MLQQNSNSFSLRQSRREGCSNKRIVFLSTFTQKGVTAEDQGLKDRSHLAGGLCRYDPTNLKPIATCGLTSSASEAKRQTVKRQKKILEEIQYLLNTDCYDQQNLRSVYLTLLNGGLKITGGRGPITATEPGTITPPTKQQGW